MSYTSQYLSLRKTQATGHIPPQRAYSKLLPPELKQSMEAICGISLNHVKVHYNSPLPVQVNAHAYAQGEHIYLAPNNEHHLPHELGHVVQQALGMVKPTSTFNGIAINDDPKLEQHATELGQQALKLYQHKIANNKS